jgi:hypothetical protein
MTVDYVRVYAPNRLPARSAKALADPGLEQGRLADGRATGAEGSTLLEHRSDGSR